ncbi:hypothetical protein FHT07_001554 [Xanthomonas arboricola]|nr:hypothetical protein [Xanthomonas arboricola]
MRPKVQVSRSASLGAPRSLRHGMIEAPAITLGANVQHPKFGGVVIDDEDSGAHARVQVQFDPARSKARRTEKAGVCPRCRAQQGHRMHRAVALAGLWANRPRADVCAAGWR